MNSLLPTSFAQSVFRHVPPPSVESFTANRIRYTEDLIRQGGELTPIELKECALAAAGRTSGDPLAHAIMEAARTDADPRTPLLFRMPVATVPLTDDVILTRSYLRGARDLFPVLDEFLVPDYGQPTNLVFVDETLLLGATVALIEQRYGGFGISAEHGSVPQKKLRNLLAENRFPLYVGEKDLHIHHIEAPAYVVGLHDADHHAQWAQWASEDRQDAVFVFDTLRAFLGLEGEEDAPAAFEDAFDFCLSGPAPDSRHAMGSRYFRIELAKGVTYQLPEGLWSDFLSFLNHRTDTHPRGDLWKDTIAKIKAASTKE